MVHEARVFLIFNRKQFCFPHQVKLISINAVVCTQYDVLVSFATSFDQVCSAHDSFNKVICSVYCVIAIAGELVLFVANVSLDLHLSEVGKLSEVPAFISRPVV